MGIKLYPTYCVVIICVKIIKLLSALSTEGGLGRVLWGKVAELQGVLSHLPMVLSHPEGSGGLRALDWETWFSSSLPVTCIYGAFPDPVLNPMWLHNEGVR